MKRALSGIVFLFLTSVLLLSSLGFGQAADSAPVFQVADIHSSPKVTAPSMHGGFISVGRFAVRQATMLDLISTAYGIEQEKIVGGPSWLNTERFDMVAGAPAATTQETAKLMLQALLTDRFKLVLRKDTKPLAAYVLSVGKGKPKIKASDGQAASGCMGVPQSNAQGGITGGYSVVACRNITMEAFATELRDMGSAYLPKPVVDSTGLKGAWDFDLKWNARNQLAAAGADGISIFDAVDKQLGLKLEPKTMPLAVMVVDSVNRNPTENAPGVTSKLPPPPPAEFEVAELKVSRPDSEQRGRIQNGRVDLQNLTLKNLITLAWDLNDDSKMAALPKFADSVHYDLIAKAPAAVAAKNEDEADIDTLRLMLQSLLADRFKLKTHTEDRPVEGYVLTAPKPKLLKADPSDRTECKDGPGKDGKDPRLSNPVLNRLMTCTNMTMAQFAEQLPVFANGYVRTAVLDSSGLEGAWDFTMSFSGIGLVRAAQAQAGGAQADPNGALSLPDAVNKQLGLKLELVKRPMPVLVIDHLEEKPTEN